MAWTRLRGDGVGEGSGAEDWRVQSRTLSGAEFEDTSSAIRRVHRHVRRISRQKQQVSISGSGLRLPSAATSAPGNS
ncbi:hypothetical protein TYRP_018121 [Tyrophagus putrescentiae]|nr:hypothetical protein TYRP_018121 [Tyrophagus putrescentiae]